jgi:hypothetical protein
MTQTPLDRGIRPWADPFWWAEQQLKLMTATAAYIGQVAEAGFGAAIPPVRQTERPEPTAPEPMVSEPEPPQAEAPAPEPESPEPEPEPEPEPKLPVMGWDELSLGSIRARLSRLSEADLVTLHAYEERHGGRPDVLSMLANRLIKIRANGRDERPGG